jgi:hypothetical protein
MPAPLINVCISTMYDWKMEGAFEGTPWRAGHRRGPQEKLWKTDALFKLDTMTNEKLKRGERGLNRVISGNCIEAPCNILRGISDC